MIKIGDKFDTEEYGYVEVIDIYVSITNGYERIYAVKDDRDTIFYCTKSTLM